MSIPIFSIVIPCKNEADNIGKLFDSILLQQKVDIHNIPIIIADAHSTDNTLGIINEYRTLHHLNIEITPGGYPAIGRNNGARLVQTDYIVFIDADITLGEPNFLHTVINKAIQNDLDLVTPYIKCFQGNFFDKIFWKIYGLFIHLSAYLKPMSSGMFMCIKGDVFWSIGGFDEKVILGEDIELSYKVNRRKFGIAKTFIYTTNRRFKKMGYLHTIVYYTLTAMSSRFRHRNNAFYFEDPEKKHQHREHLERLENGLKSIFNK